MMFQCPNCDQGRVQGLACPGGRLIISECPTCKGTGQITELQHALIRQGAWIRDLRVRSMQMSQRELANHLKMDFVELSQIERGNLEAWKKHGRKIVRVIRNLCTLYDKVTAPQAEFDAWLNQV